MKIMIDVANVLILGADQFTFRGACVFFSLKIKNRSDYFFFCT